MYCNECGAPNPDNSKFCSRCGATLTGQSQQPVSQQPIYQQPQVSESNNSISSNTTGSNSYAPRVLGVISILIFVFSGFIIIIGGGGILNIGIMGAAPMAATYFSKVEKVASVEEREKVMRKGIIALSIAAILLILWFIIMSSVN